MIIFDEKKDLFYSTKIDKTNFSSGFGSKTFDKSSLENDGKIINLWQIHKDTIALADGEENEIQDADGVITSSRNLVLTVKTADCVPIVFTDPVKKLAGISHQGWKGTLLNLPGKMIARFITLGSKKDDIISVIGPSIGACCYNIPTDRYAVFGQEFGKAYTEKRDEKFFLNLLKLNFELLQKSGIKKENIDFFPFCTQCDTGRFFSFRRGEKGRMVNWISKI